MRVNVDDVDVEGENVYFYEGAPFTGELVETGPDGRIVEFMAVREGLQHGETCARYPDGRRKFHGQCVKGRAVGTNRAWHQNGQLAVEKVFDDNGTLLSEQMWDENGSPLPTGSFSAH
ncbi:hypothetical protein GCM10022247_54340 [Allokutzneria multivorans]|uniref:MORN repeat protein n=1 Tax=Allokutzneria multivorans TaxID=1142134 RepID=A0ABP7T9S3_9PSEU